VGIPLVKNIDFQGVIHTINNENQNEAWAVIGGFQEK